MYAPRNDSKFYGISTLNRRRRRYFTIICFSNGTETGFSFFVRFVHSVLRHKKIIKCIKCRSYIQICEWEMRSGYMKIKHNSQYAAHNIMLTVLEPHMVYLYHTIHFIYRSLHSPFYYNTLSVSYQLLLSWTEINKFVKDIVVCCCCCYQWFFTSLLRSDILNWLFNLYVSGVFFHAVVRLILFFPSVL